MKRIVLFLITNLAVMVVLSIVVDVLGLNQALAANGLNLGALLVFSAVIGFGGAFISLLLSKTMAKWSTGAQVIAAPRNENETWLLATVKRLADKAGIAMPEVAMYEGEPNAFATGAFKNSALVAVSTGLLNAMSREETEAVLGHEIAHVSNGDMVTLSLIQGVVNTFVVFLARIIGTIVDKTVFRTDARLRPRLLHYGSRLPDRVRRAGLDHRCLVLAPTRVPRRCGQREVSRHAAADDACPGPARRLASRCAAEGAVRLRHHRQAGIHVALRDPSPDRSTNQRAAGAGLIIMVPGTPTKFKIEFEAGNGIWNDVRGADGALLTFDSEAEARAKLAELYPVEVQMERYGNSKRTRVIRILRDEDDWPARPRQG